MLKGVFCLFIHDWIIFLIENLFGSSFLNNLSQFNRFKNYSYVFFHSLDKSFLVSPINFACPLLYIAE